MSKDNRIFDLALVIYKQLPFWQRLSITRDPSNGLSISRWRECVKKARQMNDWFEFTVKEK